MQNDRVFRYSGAQRSIHWLLALSFFALAITGLFLVFRPAAELAAGGLSRQVHRIFAAVLLAIPVLYAVLDWQGLKRLVRDSFTYDRDDLRWLARLPRYFLGLAHDLPPQGRLNAGQKLHHALVIIGYVTISVSGLLMWLGKSLVGPGAFVAALWVHNITTYALLILTVGHIYFVFVYGALSGMLSGYVSRRYAELEHPGWLAELDRTAVGR